MSHLAKRLPMCSGPPYTGLLDMLTLWPVGAYSLRRLTGRYFGSCCRVERMSDSQSATFSFLLNGSLDTASLVAFAGTADVAVLTLYDQSGHGTSMKNYAGYPLIVKAGALVLVTGGGTLPGILGSGNSQYMLDNGSQFPINGPFSRASVNCIPASAPASAFPIMTGTSDISNEALQVVNGHYQMYNQGNSFPSSVALPFNRANSVIENFSNTASSILVNGTTTNGSMGSIADSADLISMTQGGFSGGSSIFSEVLQFDQLLDVDDMNLICADHKNYWGTP
jgi:hypothetical protein